MTDLIHRLEAAEGPSRELDVEIGMLVEGVPCERMSQYLTRYWAYREWREETKGDKILIHDRMAITAPYYTASLDAAVSLVPEGTYCKMQIGRDRKHNWVWVESVTCETVACHATPALALCIAALKAREAEND